jgi:hypothetical protein
VAALGVELVIVFAHAGHWLLSLAYLAPLLVLLGVVAVGKVKDRRAGVGGEPPPEDSDTG